MTAKLRIGLVGAGSMGSNHARILADSKRAELAAVVDVDIAKATGLAVRFGAAAATGLEALTKCDGVVVAASTEHHAEIALGLIDAGLPLLVEKPISTILLETEAVVAASQNRGLPLMCGFVERYNAAAIALRNLVDEAPIYLVAMRHSPPNPRARASVVHDLLIHDADLALRLCGDRDVARVQGATWAPQGKSAAEIANCIVEFRAGPVVMLSASRVGQRKIRTFHVDTGAALYEADLLREDLTVYQHVSHTMLGPASASYRAQTVVDIPFIRHEGEPLALEIDRFLDLIGSDSVDIDTERSSILPPHRLVAAIPAAEPTA